jgi:hypothetical protein
MSPAIDPADWLPLGGLEPGFDQYRAPLSDALEGKTFTTVDSGGGAIRNSFSGGKMRWEFEGDPDNCGVDDYEAFEVDEGLYYAQLLHVHPVGEAVSLILDTAHGTCLAVLSFALDPPPFVEPGPTAVKQAFVPGTIREYPQTGPVPSRTGALVGKRVRWAYSDVHAYEHVYLNEDWYTWHCLAGPEAGQADTDLCTAFEIRKGVYAFAWREKVIPCAAVTVADHRDAHAMRSSGVLFGPDPDKPGEFIHFTYGAFGELVSITDVGRPFESPRAARPRGAAAERSAS